MLLSDGSTIVLKNGEKRNYRINENIDWKFSSFSLATKMIVRVSVCGAQLWQDFSVKRNIAMQYYISLDKNSVIIM